MSKKTRPILTLSTIGIIIIIITPTMFMVLSSWHSHCASSPSSFDECRFYRANNSKSIYIHALINHSTGRLQFFTFNISLKSNNATHTTTAAMTRWRSNEHDCGSPWETGAWLGNCWPSVDISLLPVTWRLQITGSSSSSSSSSSSRRLKQVACPLWHYLSTLPPIFYALCTQV